MKTTMKEVEIEALKILANMKRLEPKIISLINTHFWTLLADDHPPDGWFGPEVKPINGEDLED